MKVGIIGCGASGMMAAVTAGRNGHDVTVLEHTSKIGKKILVTGNGKCNFTNAVISAFNYNNNARELLDSVYNCFDNNKTIDFFESIGIKAYEKNGYFYPRSEQAASIVEALGYALFKSGVKVIKDCNIKSILRETIDYKTYMEALNNDFDGGLEATKFIIKSDRGDFEFDKIILATGSNVAPKTGSDGSGYDIAKMLGHKIVKPLPALCGLKSDGSWLKKTAGVRCNAKVELFIENKSVKQDLGELQLTEYGISGIPVFQISAEAVKAYEANKEVYVCIDFYPETNSINDLIIEINERIQRTPDRSNEELLSGVFNRKLCGVFDDICGIDRTAKCRSLMESEVEELANVIKSLEVKIIGYNNENAQVCSGGIDCADIKCTMESRKCEGLYFAGEVVDVNGDCGGYNLQWAWSSGYVAGLLG